MSASAHDLSVTTHEIDHVASVLEKVSTLAAGCEPVLLLGPRSAGISFLAEAIHHCSPRADNPFVGARCGLYPASHLEARLFGRSLAGNRSNLPPASRQNAAVAVANGGSLFVEQIQNTTASFQTILFDLVANKEYIDYERTSIHRADVRLIASARGELESRVKSGRFLQRLFSRFQFPFIELNNSCPSPERILAVVDSLRMAAIVEANAGGERIFRWNAGDSCRGTQTAASAVLRRAVKIAALQLGNPAPVKAVFVAALRHMCQAVAEPCAA